MFRASIERVTNNAFTRPDFNFVRNIKKKCAFSTIVPGGGAVGDAGRIALPGLK